MFAYLQVLREAIISIKFREVLNTSFGKILAWTRSARGSTQGYTYNPETPRWYSENPRGGTMFYGGHWATPIMLPVVWCNVFLRTWRRLKIKILVVAGLHLQIYRLMYCFEKSQGGKNVSVIAGLYVNFHELWHNTWSNLSEVGTMFLLKPQGDKRKCWPLIMMFVKFKSVSVWRVTFFLNRTKFGFLSTSW